MSRARRMVAVAATTALLVGAASPPVFAVNDPFVPAENCSPDFSQAVGHPAIAHNQTPTTAANPPFSLTNPGVSEGAQAEDVEPPC